MNSTYYLLGISMLFLLGLRLSAFFSGVETGFYRVSFLRLTIDAQAGDKTAARLVWYLQNPSYFVATCLVGNNIANYVTTLAIGLFVGELLPAEVGWGEVLATLAISPVIFICGELLPKTLYFRAPMRLLRKDSGLFRWFYRLFLPFSLPLIGITKFFQRFSRDRERQSGLALGRNRLAQVLSMGHREGILVDVQNRMITGLMRIAQENVTASMTPAFRMIDVEETATRDQILAVAREYGAAYVVVRRAGQTDGWYGYVRTIDVLLAKGPIAPLIREMPRFQTSHNRQEALLTMRETGARMGLVEAEGRILGVIHEQGLIDALMRA